MKKLVLPFTAIDFETAQGYRNSICQVGLIRVENGTVVHSINEFVQPPGNYYWGAFTDIHGISAQDTKHSPTFEKFWHKMQPFIENQLVVAHNGFAFDFICLEKTLRHYNLEVPNYDKDCTYKIYRKALDKLCKKYNIQLNHHDALSDAKACAELYLKYLKQ